MQWLRKSLEMTYKVMLAVPTSRRRGKHKVQRESWIEKIAAKKEYSRNSRNLKNEENIERKL